MLKYQLPRNAHKISTSYRTHLIHSKPTRPFLTSQGVLCQTRNASNLPVDREPKKFHTSGNSFLKAVEKAKEITKTDGIKSKNVTEAAKPGFSLAEQSSSSKEQRKADWGILREMVTYLWPKVDMTTSLVITFVDLDEG
jgi:predicted trehalose synthase